MKLKVIISIFGFFVGVFLCTEILVGSVFVFLILICLGFWKRSLFLIFAVACVFGFFRMFFSYPSYDGSNIYFYNDVSEDVCVIGIVSEEVDVREKGIKLVLDVSEIDLKLLSAEVRGKILINTYRYPEYSFGDRLRVCGELKTPESFEKFSYRDYLARYDVYSVMYSPTIYFLSGGHGRGFYEYIYDFKKWFLNILNTSFTEPSASFMAGLLLGSRKGIPKRVMEDFGTTGLTHIIAISGYNITLLIVVVTFLFGFLSRKLQAICASVLIVVFTILVGASAACVRASCMGIISLLALYAGRKSDLDLVLLLAAFFMILWNPKILIFDVGFQLSFLATLGLIYFSPILMEISWFEKIPAFFGIRESFVLTISAQLTTLPVILYNFERFSVVAPIANVLVLPLIPISMFFGFFVVVFAKIFEPLSVLLSYFAYFFLDLIVKIAAVAASLPFASYEVTWFSIPLLILYCVLLVILYVSRFHKPK